MVYQTRKPKWPMRSRSTGWRHTPVFPFQGFLEKWCRVQTVSKAVKPFMKNWVAEDAVISSGRVWTRVRWVLWHTTLSDVTAHYTKPPFKKKWLLCAHAYMNESVIALESSTHQGELVRWYLRRHEVVVSI